MKLPTVTFEPDSEFDEEAGFSMYGRGVVFDGKTLYALVRVADGQTVTAEKVWWCEVVDRPVEDCDLDDKYHRRAESHHVVSVLLVRGASDE